MSLYRSQTIIIILCLNLFGCGFHLRGMGDKPTWLQHVAVISHNVNRDVAPYLSTMLKYMNICVDEEPKLSSYWIVLDQDKLTQRIASISSSTNARQYQLIYTLHFHLENMQTHHISNPQIIITMRQLTLNSDRILGSGDEQHTLEQEMHKEAAQLLIDRIGSTPP